MPPPSDPLSFFDELKARSLHKLGVFGDYLVPWARKLGSQCGPFKRYKHVWVIDGFAGAGTYRLGPGGRAYDGSPVIAAKRARDLELERHYPIMRCINVERDLGCFAELERNLAPWRSVATNRQGEFADRIDEILAMTGSDPVFFFLDPFGVNGVEMEVVERILARPGTTELLLHFSDKTFMRMAGYLDENDERRPAGIKVGEAKLARLDALMGSKRWRMLWSHPDVDGEQAIEATVKLYLETLRDAGWRYAYQIPMRDHYRDRPAYRLVFCTNSPHGVEMMSDIVCRSRRDQELQDDHGAVTLWREHEERQALTDLRDRIHSVGLERGVASRRDLVHAIVSENFGRYRRSDYAKAIRELVGLGLIDRPTATGIEEREPLRFIEPPQGTLLDQA